MFEDSTDAETEPVLLGVAEMDAAAEVEGTALGDSRGLALPRSLDVGERDTDGDGVAVDEGVDSAEVVPEGVGREEVVSETVGRTLVVGVSVEVGVRDAAIDREAVGDSETDTVGVVVPLPVRVEETELVGETVPTGLREGEMDTVG